MHFKSIFVIYQLLLLGTSLAEQLLDSGNSVHSTVHERRRAVHVKRVPIHRHHDELKYTRCSTETKLVVDPSEAVANITEPAPPHPKSCEDYNTTMEFVSGEEIYDAHKLFLAGTDINNRKLYICRASLNGKTYLGRGHFSRSYSQKDIVCWILLENEEFPIMRKVEFLRKPKHVILIWKNAPSKDNLAITDENGYAAYMGRTNFQVPLSSMLPECYTDPDQQEVIIPGYAYLEDTDNIGLKFTFASKVYLSTDYQLLTCADVE